MKRLLVGSALLSIGVLGVSPLVGAAVTPKTKAVTIRYFEKGLNFAFTSSSGVPLSQNANLSTGDLFTATDDDYHGNHNHHTKTLAASDALHCVITSASSTSESAACFGVFSIGGSLLYSVTTVNLASNSVTMVYPITGGTGAFSSASGRLVSTSIGNTGNSDVTLEITIP